MVKRLKVVTVVGTRPEIIRLACVIRRLDASTDHVLVHTGQNYDYTLNRIFFDELGLPSPDYFLKCDTTSLGTLLGDVLKGTEQVLLSEKPDAMVVLGDTNSCVSAVMGRRMKVPVFHLEAGNRSFDQNVPEEINRRLVDHVSDYNLVYTEHSRRNLLAEGFKAQSVMVMGSPMREVLNTYDSRIQESTVLSRLDLVERNYVLASVHREENVDQRARLTSVIAALEAVSEFLELPVLISTHPRTRKRIRDFGLSLADSLKLHEPLGFFDYNRLQLGAQCVISDSGTISEESSILGFPAVTIRDAIERPEALDAGAIIASGISPDAVVDAVRITVEQWSEGGVATPPIDYSVTDSSRRVVNFIRSMATTHHLRNAIRV